MKRQSFTLLIKFETLLKPFLKDQNWKKIQLKFETYALDILENTQKCYPFQDH
jgi:hypothetical protein